MKLPLRAVLAFTFAFVASPRSLRSEGSPRIPPSGLSVFETPEGWKPYVLGPATSFALSRDGVLFVGSNQVATFDGIRWGTVDIPDGTAFRALQASADGRRIWTGGRGTVGFIEKNTMGQWVFTSMKADLLRAGVSEIGDVRLIYLSGGSVTFVAKEVVARWHPASGSAPGGFEVWRLPSSARLYPFVDGGQLLIYQIGVGLLRFEDDGPKVWIPESDLPSRPPMVGYLSLSGGHYAVFNGELFRHAEGKWIRMDEVSAQLRTIGAQRAVPLPNGRIAIGTSYGGCIVVRADGSLEKILNLQTGLTDNNVDKLWADPSGQLWFGLWTGIARLSDYGAASIYDQKVGFEVFFTRKVFRDADEITAVTSQGIYTLSFSTPERTRNFLRSGEYFGLKRDAVSLDGEIWIIGLEGLWRVVGGQPVHVPEVASDLFFASTLRALPHGLILVGRSSCLAWIKQGDRWVTKDLGVALTEVPTSVVEGVDGSFWIATQDGLVRRYVLDPAALRLEEKDTFRPGNRLPASARPIALGRVNGRILGFGNTGVLEYHSDTRSFVPLDSFGPLQVVASTNAPDGSGYWLARRPGLGSAAPLALYHAAERTDGLSLTPLFAPGLDQVGEVTSLSFTGGEIEEIWVGGGRALLRLAVSRLAPPGPIPAVNVREVRVNPDRLYPFEGGAREIRFQPDLHRLEFAYSAAFGRGRDYALFYQTRLAGLDQEWLPPTAEARREFSGLPPGSYSFQMRAVDRFGRSGEESHLDFVVLAPWYRRPWAGALWILLLGVGIWLIMRWRIRRLNRQAERLNQLVGDRTRELSLSNTAKSEFLENISHEIRNPLNGITGLIQLLDADGLSSRQAEHASALKECSESLRRVFEEVLSFSKLEYGYVTVSERQFALIGVLEGVRSLFVAQAEAARSTLTINAASLGADGFWGDEAKVRTIVSNFVANALKYAPGTPVELSASVLSEAFGSADVLIEVSDEGPGVPPEEQELIFNKFVRGSGAGRSGVTGSGIGLATCRAMARILHGSVGIESRPGEGATFFVKLPLRRTQSAYADVSYPSSEDGRPSVLVVDDQHFNRVVLAGMVSQLGFRAQAARDVDEAVAAFLGGTYEVVFLDVELPGEKGPEIARRLRSLPGGRDVLIIGASAYDSEEATQRCLAAGMNAFLLKPFTLPMIREALNRANLNRKSGLPEDEVTFLELYAANEKESGGDAYRKFARALRDELAMLRGAVETQSAEEVWRAAHRVRSHAALAGLRSVAQAAGKLEKSARKGDLTTSAGILSELEAEADAFERRLSEEV